jgi:hypothetical protein
LSRLQSEMGEAEDAAADFEERNCCEEIRSTDGIPKRLLLTSKDEARVSLPIWAAFCDGRSRPAGVRSLRPSLSIQRLGDVYARLGRNEYCRTRFLCIGCLRPVPVLVMPPKMSLTDFVRAPAANLILVLINGTTSGARGKGTSGPRNS